MSDIGNGRAGRADVIIVGGGSAGGVLANRLSEDPTRSSVCDGTVTESGRAVDFTSANFLRIKDGVAAEHWDTVDYIRLYQSFGLLPEDPRTSDRPPKELVHAAHGESSSQAPV